MENSRTRPHLHITHIPYLVEIFRHLLVCVSSWIRILVCVMLCGQQPNRTVVDLTHLASRWTGSFSSLFADNRPESEWKQSKETEPSTTNSKKKQQKFPAPNESARELQNERPSDWLLIWRENQWLLAPTLCTTRTKKNANQMQILMSIFLFYRNIYLFFFLFFPPFVCVFFRFFFCSLHFPPFGHAHRHAPSWLAAATTPTASSWILGHRSRHADAGPLLGQMTRPRKKKIF